MSYLNLNFKSFILNSSLSLLNHFSEYFDFINESILSSFIVSIKLNAKSAVSSLKSPSLLNNSNLSFNSLFVSNPCFNGNNLISVLDGDISEIHNLLNSCSLPTLLFIKVI